CLVPIGRREEYREDHQLVGSGRRDLPVELQYLSRALEGMDQHAAGYLPERVQSKVEPGDHAKIAAAATKRPVEVGMLVCAGVHCLPAGEDDLGADTIVDGEAELATDPAHAAAKREPGHARVGCRPG